MQGRTAVLTLGQPAYPCDSATPFVLSYGPPETPTTPVVRSLDGMDSGALKYQAVTNARAGWCGAGWFDSSRIGSVIVRSKRPFATDIEPQPGWFTVTASGGPVTVTGAAFSAEDPHELRLTLDRELGPDETVTVSYRRPEGVSGLWDVTGRQLADLVDAPVERGRRRSRRASRARRRSRRGAASSSRSRKDIRDRGRAHGLHGAGGRRRRATIAAFWDERTVGLVLTEPVRSGETVTVAYAKPASGTMLHDADELAIDSFGPEAVTNPFAEAPAAPAPPVLAQASETGVTLTWAAPDNADQAPVNGYGVRYRQHGAADWARHAHTGSGASATIEALAPGNRFEAQVRATGLGGDSPWSDSGWGHTGDRPPRRRRGTRTTRCAVVTLTFAKDIAIGGGQPNYDVVVDGESRALHGAGWVDNAVYLSAGGARCGRDRASRCAYAKRASGYAVLHDADGAGRRRLRPRSGGQHVQRGVAAAAADRVVREHAGCGTTAPACFTFELHFSEDFGGRLNYRVLRDEALQAERRTGDRGAARWRRDSQPRLGDRGAAAVHGGR